MGALGHYLESEGIATTGISLVREHTAAMQPPRFLWVPFPLGRPLGAPGDAAFQHRVIGAALSLLEAPAGPVLADFPEDAPETGEDREWACPVSFPPPHAEAASGWLARVSEELRRLEPWYGLSVERRGRTTVGASGLDARAAARLVTRFLDDAVEPETSASMSRARALKLAVEDLRAFYMEAVTAQPGAHPAEAVNSWFWEETAAGEMMLALSRALDTDPDPEARGFARAALVPRAVQHRVAGRHSGRSFPEEPL